MVNPENTHSNQRLRQQRRRSSDTDTGSASQSDIFDSSGNHSSSYTDSSSEYSSETYDSRRRPSAPAKQKRNTRAKQPKGSQTSTSRPFEEKTSVQEVSALVNPIPSRISRTKVPKGAAKPDPSRTNASKRLGGKIETVDPGPQMNGSEDAAPVQNAAHGTNATPTTGPEGGKGKGVSASSGGGESLKHTVTGPDQPGLKDSQLRRYPKRTLDDMHFHPDPYRGFGTALPKPKVRYDFRSFLSREEVADEHKSKAKRTTIGESKTKRITELPDDYISDKEQGRKPTTEEHGPSKEGIQKAISKKTKSAAGETSAKLPGDDEGRKGIRGAQDGKVRHGPDVKMPRVYDLTTSEAEEEERQRHRTSPSERINNSPKHSGPHAGDTEAPTVKEMGWKADGHVRDAKSRPQVKGQKGNGPSTTNLERKVAEPSKSDSLGRKHGEGQLPSHFSPKRSEVPVPENVSVKESATPHTNVSKGPKQAEIQNHAVLKHQGNLTSPEKASAQHTKHNELHVEPKTSHPIQEKAAAKADQMQSQSSESTGPSSEGAKDSKRVRLDGDVEKIPRSAQSLAVSPTERHTVASNPQGSNRRAGREFGASTSPHIEHSTSAHRTPRPLAQRTDNLGDPARRRMGGNVAGSYMYPGAAAAGSSYRGDDILQDRYNTERIQDHPRRGIYPGTDPFYDPKDSPAPAIRQRPLAGQDIQTTLANEGQLNRLQQLQSSRLQHPLTRRPSSNPFDGPLKSKRVTPKAGHPPLYDSVGDDTGSAYDRPEGGLTSIRSKAMHPLEGSESMIELGGERAATRTAINSPELAGQPLKAADAEESSRIVRVDGPASRHAGASKHVPPLTVESVSPTHRRPNAKENLEMPGNDLRPDMNTGDIPFTSSQETSLLQSEKQSKQTTANNPTRKARRPSFDSMCDATPLTSPKGGVSGDSEQRIHPQVIEHLERPKKAHLRSPNDEREAAGGESEITGQAEEKQGGSPSGKPESQSLAHLKAIDGESDMKRGDTLLSPVSPIGRGRFDKQLSDEDVSISPVSPVETSSLPTVPKPAYRVNPTLQQEAAQLGVPEKFWGKLY